MAEDDPTERSGWNGRAQNMADVVGGVECACAVDELPSDLAGEDGGAFIVACRVVVLASIDDDRAVGGAALPDASSHHRGRFEQFGTDRVRRKK